MCKADSQARPHHRAALQMLALSAHGPPPRPPRAAVAVTVVCVASAAVAAADEERCKADSQARPHHHAAFGCRPCRPTDRLPARHARPSP